MPDAYAQLNINPSLLHTDCKLKGYWHILDEDWLHVQGQASHEDCNEKSAYD